MKHKKEIQEELDQIAPFLAKIEKRESYQVPHDYFTRLSEQISTQVALEPRQKIAAQVPPTSLWRSLTNLLAGKFQMRTIVAAASVLLCVGSFFYWSSGQQSSVETIAAAQYLSYVEENLDEFEEEILLELNQEEDLGIDLLTDTEIKEQTLDNYLEEFLDDLEDQSLEELL
ncbi:MAG: hypothetical protein AB8G15_06745 [Saprospiraceae bacterium]